MIKNVSKEILTKAIYPEEELIRTELDRYIKSNYKEDYKKIRQISEMPII